VIGVKVWIYRGDIYEQKRRQFRGWKTVFKNREP